MDIYVYSFLLCHLLTVFGGNLLKKAVKKKTSSQPTWISTMDDLEYSLEINFANNLLTEGNEPKNTLTVFLALSTH